jgi:hypothetical protein
MKAFIQASPPSECPTQPTRDEAEADQSEEGQCEVENPGETRFHPAEKKQEDESGGRSEKSRETGKRDRQHLLGNRRFAAPLARNGRFQPRNAYCLGNL